MNGQLLIAVDYPVDSGWITLGVKFDSLWRIVYPVLTSLVVRFCFCGLWAAKWRKGTKEAREIMY